MVTARFTQYLLTLVEFETAIVVAGAEGPLRAC
jgi:hypothetical protein